ncbi:hypothetical protein BS47DRAFT_1397065 [Hydnum rufescens UP504]|uniref:Uncharacterized protein n=1 Tax=Hydnum rufescens UP504 TaxID=1448309 RepID=A0A9P6ANY1_9AGAM|nr:hypothetical protein BS47DRAFT_1397065 [Hydnum rufescens UP504]
MAMATVVRMEDAWWDVLASNTTLGSTYDLFCPHPPLPLKLAHTPDIPVGWYLPLSSSLTPMASSADSPAVTDVATSSRAPNVVQGGPTEANLGLTGADPGIVGNEMEGVEHPLGDGDTMDINTAMDGVEHALNHDDTMDVNLDTDDLNERISMVAEVRLQTWKT